MVRRALVALSALGLVAGCNAILGIERGEPKPIDVVDSGSADSGNPDTSVDDGGTLEAEAGDETNDARSAETNVSEADVSEADATEICTSVRWPQAPGSDDPGSSADLDVEVAAETIQLDIVPELGFDLDGRCSCHPDPASCVPKSGRVDLQCDQTGGRDLMANTLVPTWAALGLTALSQPSLNGDMKRGRAGALVRLHNYNGLANDKLVTLEFFGKTWIPPVGGVEPIPQHDGSDTWSVYRDSFVGVSTAVENDIAAYVNDHVLVAKLRTATIALRPNTGVVDNPLVIELLDAVLTGTLVPTDRGFRIESGQISGRWPAHKALFSFGALADASGFICGTHPFFAPLRAQVCGSLDIASARADDNTGATCDAISIAFGFTAGPAHVGPPIDPPMVQPTCPAGWAPNCNVP